MSVMIPDQQSNPNALLNKRF